MKSFTDIEQSKKLAKILQFKSADMSYIAIIEDYTYPQKVKEYKLTVKDECFNPRYDIPAWSLSALLELMPITCILSISNGHYRIASNETNTFFHDNPIDACYEMIVKLNEKELI